LRKLIATCERYREGVALFTDGTEVIVENYDGAQRHYHCGKDYLKVQVAHLPPKLLVVVDANEATIGEIDGEQIGILWHEISMVPRKHKAGGQSQHRFERDRDRALKQWLKLVADKVMAFHKDRPITIGGPGMTKQRLIPYLHAYCKVAAVESVGYTDENGLWELAKISRYVT